MTDHQGSRGELWELQEERESARDREDRGGELLEGGCYCRGVKFHGRFLQGECYLEAMGKVVSTYCCVLLKIHPSNSKK